MTQGSEFHYKKAERRKGTMAQKRKGFKN